MSNFYINNFKCLKFVIIFLAFVSIIICTLLYEPLNKASNVLNDFLIVNKLEWLCKIGYCFQPLSFSVVFSILWTLFNLFGWKLFAVTGVLTNLNGTWCGHINSRQYGIRYCTMIVKQHFVSIHIKCYFSEKSDCETKSSYSVGFNFNIKNFGDKKHISFSYKNINQNNDSPDFQHPGFNFFYLDDNRLDGCYCTFRNDRTFGDIVLVKKNNETKYKKEIWKKENFDS